MRIGIINTYSALRQNINDQILEVTRAEEDGFEHYWFVHMPHFGNDALTMVSLAGQKTHRIELGTAVVPTYPRHPFVLAQQAMTSQVATDGRLSLGVGPSHDFVIKDMLGIEFNNPAKHTREYLTVLRGFMETGKVNYSGDFFNINAELSVTGFQKCPVLLAALGPLMLRVAGELADGTITWVTGPKTLENHIIPRISEAAAKADRDPPRIVVILPVIVTEDEDRGRALVNKIIGQYGDMKNYRRVLDREGVETPGQVALVGPKEKIEDQLYGLSELGVTDFCALLMPSRREKEAYKSSTWAALRDWVSKF